jgi:hypothetical protein
MNPNGNVQMRHQTLDFFRGIPSFSDASADVGTHHCKRVVNRKYETASKCLNRCFILKKLSSFTLSKRR